jgi:hypothetical protein
VGEGTRADKRSAAHVNGSENRRKQGTEDEHVQQGRNSQTEGTGKKSVGVRVRYEPLELSWPKSQHR